MLPWYEPIVVNSKEQGGGSMPRKSLSDPPIGVHPDHVMAWVRTAMATCDHVPDVDGSCDCQGYIAQIVASYSQEILRLAPKGRPRPISPREVLEEVGNQCDFETDLIKLQERNMELERRVRHLSDMLRQKVIRVSKGEDDECKPSREARPPVDQG